MTLKEALSELRVTLRDVDAPYGWQDSELKGWLSEGQDKFCEATGMFIDATSYTIPTVQGTATYAMSARVIELLELWTTSGYLTEIKNPQRFKELMLDATQGEPKFYSLDYIPGSITVFPIPDAVYTLRMRVWRKSLVSTTLEIADESAQRAPIEYAAKKAYNIQDAELNDPQAAAKHEAEYKRYCTEAKRAIDRKAAYAPQGGCNPSYVV
jgi:hypothetical protein